MQQSWPKFRDAPPKSPKDQEQEMTYHLYLEPQKEMGDMYINGTCHKWQSVPHKYYIKSESSLLHLGVRFGHSPLLERKEFIELAIRT
jgi:hypothetical protein